MNNEESKLPKPMSEEESQPSLQQVGNTQSSVTGFELQRQSPSSQPEARNLPSSSGEETGASENKTEKTSSEDKKLQLSEQQSSVSTYSDSSKAQYFSTKSTDYLRTEGNHRRSRDKPGNEKELSTDLANNLSGELLKTSTFKNPVNVLEDMTNKFLESGKLRDSRPIPKSEDTISQSPKRQDMIPSIYRPKRKLDDLIEDWIQHEPLCEPECLRRKSKSKMKLDPTGVY